MSDLDLKSFIEDLKLEEVQDLLRNRVTQNLGSAQAALTMMVRSLSSYEDGECSLRSLEDNANVCALVLQTCIITLLQGEFPKYLALVQRSEDEYAAMIEQSEHADHD